MEDGGVGEWYCPSYVLRWALQTYKSDQSRIHARRRWMAYAPSQGRACAEAVVAPDFQHSLVPQISGSPRSHLSACPCNIHAGFSAWIPCHLFFRIALSPQSSPAVVQIRASAQATTAAAWKPSVDPFPRNVGSTMDRGKLMHVIKCSSTPPRLPRAEKEAVSNRSRAPLVCITLNELYLENGRKEKVGSGGADSCLPHEAPCSASLEAQNSFRPEKHFG